MITSDSKSFHPDPTPLGCSQRGTNSGRDALGGVKSRETCKGLGGVVHAYNPSTREAEAADCEIGGQSGLPRDAQGKNLQWFRDEEGSEAQVYTSICQKCCMNAGTAHDFTRPTSRILPSLPPSLPACLLLPSTHSSVADWASYHLKMYFYARSQTSVSLVSASPVYWPLADQSSKGTSHVTPPLVKHAHWPLITFLELMSQSLGLSSL